MMNTGCLFLLLYPAIADIRYRKFYIEPVIVIGVLFTVIRVIGKPSSIINAGLGCLPGISFWGVSKLTKGAVGFGDVVVIICMGMLIGWEYTSIICMTALMMTGFIGLVLLILGKADRKTALPFVPFLLIAFLFLRCYLLRG